LQSGARRLALPGPLPYKARLRIRVKGASVMKKGIHPNYHFVEVRLNDGSTYKTRTTWGEAGQQLTLDIDPTTHPAWTGGQQQLMDRGGRLTRFNKKFAGFVKPDNK
jgi:large subunit ribosomal protein L31